MRRKRLPRASIERRDEWIAYWPRQRDPAFARLDDLLLLVAQSGIVLKDDHRSFVKRLSVADRDLIAKQPRDKNRRTWIRLLTFFRSSEVVYTLRSMDRLQRQGVQTTLPLAALERRLYGMVFDSWLFYYYRAGRRCGEAEYPLAVAALSALHRAGIRHEDPHIENFLFDGTTVFVLDCKGKRRLGRVSDYNDFILLQQRSDEDLGPYIDIDTESIAFHIASTYSRYRRARKVLKDWFRHTVLGRGAQRDKRGRL